MCDSGQLSVAFGVLTQVLMLVWKVLCPSVNNIK